MWPSVTVCNLNQVQASWLKLKGYYGNRFNTEKMVNKSMGSEGNADFLGAASLTKSTRQRCRNLFTSMSFQGKNLIWKDIPFKDQYHPNIGPSYFPTDFGACCLFVPHIDFEGFDPTIENITYVEKKHELVTTALNGESNGLRQGSLNINKVPIHNTGWISLRVSKYSPTPKSHKHLMERFYVILLRLC